MCGINGIHSASLPGESGNRIAAMNRRIAHRGPDDSGIFIDDRTALGHLRLAILDLSSAGHQPMEDESGRFVIVYNGEVYNFNEIRKELPAVQFRTRTDTEVILEAYKAWGKDCLSRFNGMFAFAIWDKQEKELFIGRDRLGIKPLYYHVEGECLYFSSEIRGLLASGAVPGRINKERLHEFFTYQTVHSPNTLLEGVSMLPPGHYMVAKEGRVTISEWWSPAKNKRVCPQNLSYNEICREIHRLLTASVERRLISDVPFGAFLSGGIDSSAITGLMSRISNQKVKTFTITFDESAFSEAKFARAVAEKFGTEHHEFRLRPADFLHELPRALGAIDHPSGDGPNSFIVSRITREAGITMALSGLGGDELFAGYPVFRDALQIEKYRSFYRIPIPLRRLAGYAAALLTGTARGDKISQLFGLEDASPENLLPLYRQIGAPQHVRNLLSFDDTGMDAMKRIILHEIHNSTESLPLLSKISIGDITTYMQNVLLRDTDQMSMAVALEVRVPFLDFELVEFVLGIPDHYKTPSYPKKLLVESLGDLLPHEIVHREKMGFVFPWEKWLKKDLKPLCSHHIDQLSTRGFINGDYLKNSWRRFLDGDRKIRWIDIWLCTVLDHWMEENRIES